MRSEASRQRVDFRYFDATLRSAFLASLRLAISSELCYFQPIFQRASATTASPAHSALLLLKILLLTRLRIRPCRNRLLQIRRRNSSTALLLDFRWTSFHRLTVRSARFTLTAARCVKRRKRCF